MNIVILHCHFERGGVTQVVENHLRFLSDCSEVDNVLLVSGKRIGGLSAESLDSAKHLCIEAMDYDSLLNPSGSIAERSDALATQITTALAAHGVNADDAVLHWHNHSLGKNVAVPAAIAKLSEQHWRLLLQVHDFAEDNRPGNYAEIINACGAKSPAEVDAFLYPTSLNSTSLNSTSLNSTSLNSTSLNSTSLNSTSLNSTSLNSTSGAIHYAALTQADRQVFVELGISQSQIHCLPNSVTAASVEAIDRDTALAGLRQTLQLPADARWCVYPVRGIRRKNVGELLLLSRWLPESTYAGITLRPTTPVEAKSYDRWRERACSVAPRAVFDVGHHEEISFAQNLAASDYILSTSVAEGFGMVFLEPWLSGRSVIARSLPTVAKDFQAAGIKFPLLYESISIPGTREWIDSCVAESEAANQQAWSAVSSAFRPELSSNASEADAIDFAMLTPKRQVEVLKRLASDSGFERDARQANPQLCAQICQRPDEDVVQHNAKRVREFYSPESQGQTLLKVYHKTLVSSSSGQASESTNALKKRVPAIDCVSAMRPLFPCRTEEFLDA